MAEEDNQDLSQIFLYLIIEYTPQRYISAAVYSQRLRSFTITSFSDNQSYTNLQSLLIQLNSHEKNEHFSIVVLMKNDIKSEVGKIASKVSELDCRIIKEQNKKYNEGELEIALNNLLKKQISFYLKQMQDKKSLQALFYLLRTIELEKDSTNKKQFVIESMKLDKFMKLDQPVINALLIFPKDMSAKAVSGTNTIFQILNVCKTQIGTRCLKRWMRQPLQDADQLNERLDKVEFLATDHLVRNSIQNELKKIPDLDALYYIFYKVESGKKNNVQVHDLIKMYRTVKTVEEILNNLKNFNLERSPLSSQFSQLQNCSNKMDMICKMIQNTITMEGKEFEFRVRADRQKDLSIIQKEQMKMNREIDEHVEEVENMLGISILKQPSNVHRWVLQGDKKKAIEQVKQLDGFKYLTSKLSKITFTTDRLISLCKSLMFLEQDYKEKEKVVLDKMYQVVAGYYPVLEELSKLISQLDVLTAFAIVAAAPRDHQTPWTRPYFSNHIKAQDLHHPCVKTCVPNDCDISDNKTIILTGPNMGGKSTYIRTVGLAIYLAHIGCYVPAKKLQTSIVDSIITRVGASDLQIKGISTFMNEMLESVTMLHSATSKSLVLIDELGRGTSTSEGFGIAWAICWELHVETNPYCLFATHFHEMTRMAEEVEGVKNMYTSCRFENNQLRLEYKVLQGKMNKSYGIEVAKMLGFPTKVVNNAEFYLNLYENQQLSAEEQRQIYEKRQTKNLSAAQNLALNLFTQMNLELNQLPEQEKDDVKKAYKQKIKLVLGKQ